LPGTPYLENFSEVPEIHKESIAMRIPILIALILTPGLSFAQTDCRTVEYQDHVEVVCSGDEKALPAPDALTAAAERNQSVQEKTPITETPAPASSTQAQPAPADATQPQTVQSPAPQGAVVHRQGRQQYQKAMEDARAARSKLILDQQKKPPAP
jgi:hypothetical protein